MTDYYKLSEQEEMPLVSLLCDVAVTLEDGETWVRIAGTEELIKAPSEALWIAAPPAETQSD